MEPPLRAAFLFAGGVEKVFNTSVENSVEKRGSIFVSDSEGDGSALCTGASAGTLVVLRHENSHQADPPTPSRL
jgi:hypothetical protein